VSAPNKILRFLFFLAVERRLKWNCRHLVNIQILERLEAEAIKLGWELPPVCTALELMGDHPYETRPDS